MKYGIKEPKLSICIYQQYTNIHNFQSDKASFQCFDIAHCLNLVLTILCNKK